MPPLSDKKQKPTAKDAQRQHEDEILKRMRETPPTPHKSKKEDRNVRTSRSKINRLD